MAKKTTVKRNCLTVRQLIAQLKAMPPDAPVRFLNTDDPEYSAADVEGVDTVAAFQKDLGHSDAAKTVREAGLRRGEVVVMGVVR